MNCKILCTKVKVAQLCPTLCSLFVVCQAPLSMEFSGQEYWSGLPFPSPRDLPYPGIEPMSLTSPALAGGFSLSLASPGKQLLYGQLFFIAWVFAPISPLQRPPLK